MITISDGVRNAFFLSEPLFLSTITLLESQSDSIKLKALDLYHNLSLKCSKKQIKFLISHNIFVTLLAPDYENTLEVIIATVLRIINNLLDVGLEEAGGSKNDNLYAFEFQEQDGIDKMALLQ